ncbi:MAG: hypothetical protein V4550_13855 [Gemmatimonadota bacterium]
MTARNHPLRPFVIVLGLATLLVAPLRAQEQATSPASAPTTEVTEPAKTPVAQPASEPSAPTMDAAAVGVRRTAEPALPAAPVPGKGGTFTTGQKHMIIGGAAIITGIVVGGNPGYAISVVGGVVFLYGLYEYLQ